jgi:hypothetical protein
LKARILKYKEIVGQKEKALEEGNDFKTFFQAENAQRLAHFNNYDINKPQGQRTFLTRLKTWLRSDFH